MYCFHNVKHDFLNIYFYFMWIVVFPFPQANRLRLRDGTATKVYRYSVDVLCDGLQIAFIMFMIETLCADI